MKTTPLQPDPMGMGYLNLDCLMEDYKFSLQELLPEMESGRLKVHPPEWLSLMEKGQISQYGILISAFAFGEWLANVSTPEYFRDRVDEINMQPSKKTRKKKAEETLPTAREIERLLTREIE